MQKTGGKNLLTILLTFLILASAISVNKIILSTFAPMFFVGIRMFSAGALLYVYGYFKSHKLKMDNIKQDVKILLAMALFTTFIPAILKAYALKYMPSSKAALFGSLDPFITAIYAYILFNERLNLNKIIGIIIAFIGVVLLVLSSSKLEETLPMIGYLSYPEIAALLAVVISRYGWMIAQSMLRKNRYSPLELNGIMMLISGATALIVSPFIEPITFSQKHMTNQLLLLLLYTILIGNILGYGMYSSLLKKYSSTLISLAGFSVPVFVFIFGTIFLKESFSIYFVASSLITLLGLLIFYFDEIKKHKV